MTLIPRATVATSTTREPTATVSPSAPSPVTAPSPSMRERTAGSPAAADMEVVTSDSDDAEHEDKVLENDINVAGVADDVDVSVDDDIVVLTDR